MLHGSTKKFSLKAGLLFAGLGLLNTPKAASFLNGPCLVTKEAYGLISSCEPEGQHAMAKMMKAQWMIVSENAEGRVPTSGVAEVSNQELDKLKTQLEKLTQEKTAAETEKGNLADEIAKLKKLNKQLVADKGVLEKWKVEIESDPDEAKKGIAKELKELLDKTKELGDKKAEWEDLKLKAVKLEEVQEELKTLKAEKASIDAEIQTLKTDNARVVTLEQEIQELEGERNSLQQRLIQSDEELKSIESKIRETLEKAKTDIEELIKDLPTREKECDSDEELDQKAHEKKQIWRRVGELINEKIEQRIKHATPRSERSDSEGESPLDESVSVATGNGGSICDFYASALKYATAAGYYCNIYKFDGESSGDQRDYLYNLIALLLNQQVLPKLAGQAKEVDKSYVESKYIEEYILEEAGGL